MMFVVRSSLRLASGVFQQFTLSNILLVNYWMEFHQIECPEKQFRQSSTCVQEMPSNVSSEYAPIQVTLVVAIEPNQIE